MNLIKRVSKLLKGYGFSEADDPVNYIPIGEIKRLQRSIKLKKNILKLPDSTHELFFFYNNDLRSSIVVTKIQNVYIGINTFFPLNLRKYQKYSESFYGNFFDFKIKNLVNLRVNDEDRNLGIFNELILTGEDNLDYEIIKLHTDEIYEHIKRIKSKFGYYIGGFDKFFKRVEEWEGDDWIG